MWTAQKCAQDAVTWAGVQEGTTGWGEVFTSHQQQSAALLDKEIQSKIVPSGRI